MHRILQRITNRIASKKGAWITLVVWLIAAIVLSIAAPSSKDYSVNNVSKLYPETSPSEIAQQKVDEHFKEDDGVPAIVVFESNEISLDQLSAVTEELSNSDISYVRASSHCIFYRPRQQTLSF